MSNKKLVVVVGPTASGKSDLAVELARKFNGEVISADSRQVYRGLDIGSGKITKREMRGVPHHLLDVANPRRTFTVAEYQRIARKALEGIWKRGKLPILCGGTGFYIQAVVDGLIIPEVKPNPALRRKLEKKTAEELFAMLKKKDNARAKTIDRNNRVRLIRALEIVEALGKVPKLRTKPIEADVLIIGVKRSDAELKRRLRRRVDEWLRRGLVKEVRKLSRTLTWGKIDGFGLVYKWASRLAQKKITKSEFVKNLDRDLWRYVKRQMTWFRKDERIHWTKNKTEAFKLSEKFVEK